MTPCQVGALSDIADPLPMPTIILDFDVREVPNILKAYKPIYKSGGVFH